MTTIGVLATQGSVIEHIQMLRKIGVETVYINLPGDLDRIDGLIIPGGESTTIGKLAVLYGLMEPIKEMAKTKPIWGTCAGMVLMAKESGLQQPLLGIMDISVERNAFGRQINSFEKDIFLPSIDKGTSEPFPAVFIRAPKIVKIGKEVQIMASLEDGTVIAAIEKKMMVTSFHPELTQDTRVHDFFVRLTR